MRMLRFHVGVILVGAVAVGCAVGHRKDGGAVDEVQPEPTPATPRDCSSLAGRVDEAPIRRLTRVEYNNTIRDLLGDTSEPASTFVNDPEVKGFSNNAKALTVTQLLAGQIFAAAEALALSASTRLDKLVSCNLTDDTCVRQFVTTFGKRVYRRPLDDAEVLGLKDLYRSGSIKSQAEGIRLVLERMLVSPKFLYRIELANKGKPGEVVPLSNYEVASRLSYFLWETMPDDVLFKEADGQRLDTPERIAAQARRMLDDPRAKRTVTNFHSQWLGVRKLPAVAKTDPAFTPAVRASMMAEAEHFADDVFWSGGGAKGVFSGDYTFVDDTLAGFYGVARAAGGGLTKAAADAQRHVGVLTLGALLTANARPEQTSPVHRGKFVRERLLCQEMAPPPGNIVIVPPKTTSGKTARERWAAHSANEPCKSCHRLTDPIGFGFENFDEIGRWRTSENGVPIDATGDVIGTADIDGRFVGVAELGAKLSRSPEAQACIVTQWYRFAYGRAETDSDKCAIDALSTQFSTSQNMREMLVSMVQTDSFRYRKVVGGAP